MTDRLFPFSVRSVAGKHYVTPNYHVFPVSNTEGEEVYRAEASLSSLSRLDEYVKNLNQTGKPFNPNDFIEILAETPRRTADVYLDDRDLVLQKYADGVKGPVHMMMQGVPISDVFEYLKKATDEGYVLRFLSEPPTKLEDEVESEKR